MEEWKDRIEGILDSLEDRAEVQYGREATEAIARRSGYMRACEDIKSKIRTEIHKDLAKDRKGTMPGRKKVFICSPFRGDRQGNTERAAGYSRMAYEKGCLPIAPHLQYRQPPRGDRESAADVRVPVCHRGGRGRIFPAVR